MRFVHDIHKFQCTVECLIASVCLPEYFTFKGILVSFGIGSLQWDLLACFKFLSFSVRCNLYLIVRRNRTVIIWQGTELPQNETLLTRSWSCGYQAEHCDLRDQDNRDNNSDKGNIGNVGNQGNHKSVVTIVTRVVINIRGFPYEAPVT
jgi:hypothetical protein